jgi:hypothetical protein
MYPLLENQTVERRRHMMAAVTPLERTRWFDCDQSSAGRHPSMTLSLAGLMGEDVPYPTERHGRDLSRNREALLKAADTGTNGSR